MKEKNNQEADKQYSELSYKFEKALDEQNILIDKHIEDAKQSLKAAEAISEASGIPFSSEVSIFEVRTYTPTTYNEKWGNDCNELMKLNIHGYYDLLDHYDLRTIDNNDDGWEYWNSSSLTC